MRISRQDGTETLPVLNYFNTVHLQTHQVYRTCSCTASVVMAWALMSYVMMAIIDHVLIMMALMSWWHWCYNTVIMSGQS